MHRRRKSPASTYASVAGASSAEYSFFESGKPSRPARIHLTHHTKQTAGMKLKRAKVCDTVLLFTYCVSPN